MSSGDVRFALVALSAVFFVVDPLAAVPIFLSITKDDSIAKRRAIALRTAAATFVVLAGFAVSGGLIFKAFGITLGAFKVAGGILLLLMAIDMMRAQRSRTRSSPEEEIENVPKDDVAIVPMAIPMLAGPGAIATVMVFMSRAAWRPAATASVLLAVVATCVATWLILRAAASAGRLLSTTMLHVLERVMGLLLAAVAVEFILSGLGERLGWG